MLKSVCLFIMLLVLCSCSMPVMKYVNKDPTKDTEAVLAEDKAWCEELANKSSNSPDLLTVLSYGVFSAEAALSSSENFWKVFHSCMEMKGWEQVKVSEQEQGKQSAK